MLSAALGAFLGVVIVLMTWRAMGSASTTPASGSTTSKDNDLQHRPVRVSSGSG
jgi:hypothetical protein